MNFHNASPKSGKSQIYAGVDTSTQMNEWFENEWAGIAQVFVIRRYVNQGEKEREETVSGLTNLPRKKANAKRLLEWNQKHWRIENR